MEHKATNQKKDMDKVTEPTPQQLEINDILYCDNGQYGTSLINKYVVVKVTPTTATLNDVQRPRIEAVVNRNPSNGFLGKKSFSGKGEYKYKDFHFENPTWIEKYERQELLSFLSYELRSKTDWLKLPTDKLKELKNLIGK